jgi:hypothetical protein
MTSGVIEAVAASVRAEAAEDYVGLWSVVRHLRQEMPDADDDALQPALEGVIRRVLSSGCVFGQFISDCGFVAWPEDRVIDQMLDELASLGRDPDIGEVGWFVASPEAPA